MNNDLATIGAQIENEVWKNFKALHLESPSDLFLSVAENAPTIAEANITNGPKALALTEAFESEDAAILFYLPGFLPKGKEANAISTGLSIDGKPLKIAFQGGGALLGIGFEGDGERVQLFHLDLIIPGKSGHSTSNGTGNARDIYDWIDANDSQLNYQVPKAN